MGFSSFCAYWSPWHSLSAALTTQALKWTQSIWEGLPDETRAELTELQLWERENMVAFGREVRQG